MAAVGAEEAETSSREVAGFSLLEVDTWAGASAEAASGAAEAS